jgi:hypothetical protein
VVHEPALRRHPHPGTIDAHPQRAQLLQLQLVLRPNVVAAHQLEGVHPAVAEPPEAVWSTGHLVAE